MKAAVVALALVASCALSVHASTGRQLLQTAPAPGPCVGVADVAQQAGLTDLLQAVQLAGLTSTVANTSAAFTIFAPTNDAFAKAIQAFGVPDLTLDALQQQGLLEPVLLNHVVEQPYTVAELESIGSVTPLSGQELKISSDGTVTTQSGNSAKIAMADVQACETIVQVIDTVLVPQLT